MRAGELGAVLGGHATSRTDDVVEEVGTIPIDGHRSIYVLVRPRGEAKETGLIVCPSIFEIWMLQASEMRLARAAAAHGFSVLYVQPPGTGDSEGPARECFVSTRVDTALAGFEFLSARLSEVKRPCFLGARMGGAIATLTAAASPQPASLVLWDPSFVASDYWQQTRRLMRVRVVMSRTQSAVDPEEQLRDTGEAVVFGVTTTAEQLRDLETVNSKLAHAEVAGPALALFVDRSRAQDTVRELRRMVATTVDNASLHKRDFLHLGLRNPERVVDPTLEWISSRLP